MDGPCILIPSLVTNTTTQNGNTIVTNPNRIQVYQASYSWNHKYFNLDGFYRTGHYHWGYEGDFFGLYPEVWQAPTEYPMTTALMVILFVGCLMQLLKLQDQ